MFNATSHPYMQEDHIAALNMLIRNDLKTAQLLNQLYRQAKNLLDGVNDPENPKFIRRKTDQDGNKTAVVISSETGQFVQLSLKPSESNSLQLSVGKFSLMTVVDTVRSTFSVKLWN